MNEVVNFPAEGLYALECELQGLPWYGFDGGYEVVREVARLHDEQGLFIDLAYAHATAKWGLKVESEKFHALVMREVHHRQGLIRGGEYQKP